MICLHIYGQPFYMKDNSYTLNDMNIFALTFMYFEGRD